MLCDRCYSHSLEHTSSTLGETINTLRGKVEIYILYIQQGAYTVYIEWNRVLKPEGLLFVAVPDLTNIARLYAQPSYPRFVRLNLLTLLYGGQRDKYDFHVVSCILIL